MRISHSENLHRIRRESSVFMSPSFDADFWERVSSSEAPCFTSTTVSRLPSPPDQAHNDGQSNLRTIGGPMAGTTGRQNRPAEKGHVRGGDNNSSNLFEFRGSDDEVLMGPIRKRSKVCLSILKPFKHVLTLIIVRLLC